MTAQVMKSVRLPESLVREIELKAEELGLTFADLVETSLRKEMGMRATSKVELMTGITDWLNVMYPRQEGFPEDVTLLVFRQIQVDEGMISDYDAAIRDDDGTVDERIKGSLHRQIGQQVRRVLKARVKGRSIELDPGIELIKTHALLVPQD